MNKFERLLCILGIAFITLCSRAQPAITNGLLAFYPLDGNANDFSGNSKHGTPVNGVSYVVQSNRYVAHFSGNGQYISLPSSISNYQDLTLTFWIKTGASDTNTLPWGTFVVSRDLWGYARDWNICIEQGRKFSFAELEGILLTPNDVGSNQWVHVACVVDSSGQAKRIYLNGQQVASESWTPYAFENIGTPIYLGAATVETSGHTFFKGEMADVALYRRALSGPEIQQVYQGFLTTARTTIGMYAGVTIVGAVGLPYSVQYSTELASNSWTTIINIILQQPIQLWVDTSVNALSIPRRFYRVVPGP